MDRALTEGRALAVTWLNRGTLHLFFVLNGHHGIITPNGLFRPFALVTGVQWRLGRSRAAGSRYDPSRTCLLRTLASYGRTRYA